MNEPTPGIPGGAPAGARPGNDPGRPGDPAPSPEDDLPALEPGEAAPPRPAPAPEPTTAPAAPAGRSPGGDVLGQGSPFARESASQADAAAYWNPWDKPDRASWTADVVRSPYTVLEGLGSGAAKGEAVLAGMLHTPMSPDDAQMLAAGVDPQDIARARKEAEAMQAAGAAHVSQDARDRVHALTPDPNTVGAATQVIHGITESAELAITGSLAGGLAGAAGALGSAEGLSRYQELKEQGVDDRTALESAGLTGVVSGAGALLPGGVGSTLTARVLTGAGGNVALGGLNRYADSRILEAGGYAEMADQQRFWDGTQMLTDAVLGSLFGGLAHLHASQAEDAARTLNTTLNARRSAPGVAISPESAVAHEANLQKATEDLTAGRPVDVSTGPRGDYLERPVESDPAMAQAVLDHFKESGLLDEEANLADLEAQLGQRMGREGPMSRNEPESATPDRRQDTVERRRISDMSPAELRQELLTNDLTGIPNRRAYEESAKLPAQASIDVDSLKWVNDNLGHEAGDQLLKAVASSLSQHSPHAFHVSGDEFILQSATPEQAKATLKQVDAHLADHTLEFQMPDGSTRQIKGLGISYGVGKDLHEAEQGLSAHKQERESSGLRAKRGERPPGAAAADRAGGGEAQAGDESGTADRPAAEPAAGPVAAPEDLAARINRDTDLRAGLEAMKAETGWAQTGGRVLMDENGLVTGRTSWIPREQWWAERPKDLTESQVHEAVDKALRGDRLGTRQAAIVQFMADVHDERVQRAGIRSEMAQAIPDLASQPRAAADLTELAARAGEFDSEGAVNVIDNVWKDDTPETLARVQDALETIIGNGRKSEAESIGRQEPATPARGAAASDLFGEAPTAAQALANEQRRRDVARAPNRDVSVETGDPSDLFSQARNQTDLVDQALKDRPDLAITADQSGREALDQVNAAAEATEREMPAATKAAVDCFLRKGS